MLVSSLNLCSLKSSNELLQQHPSVVTGNCFPFEAFQKYWDGPELYLCHQLGFVLLFQLAVA